MNGLELPTLYEYYTNGGIKSGLVAEGEHFTLNDKQIIILSGSLHYFRVVPQYWKDRLLKMKASGLNAVQLYVPWNLHEEIPGNYNFSGMLDLELFLKDIKDADMFAMLRPGPYICAEWEFGGLPSWLLRDPNMKVRSNYGPFKNATEKYFEKLISRVKKYQFSNGGPIIAVQVENEFASYGNTKSKSDDMQYITFLKEILLKFGIRELMFTSDNTLITSRDHGSINGLLMTANFNTNPSRELNELSLLQPKRPRYVAEFWSGWFDFWGDRHHTTPINDYQTVYETIIFTMNSSVNIYMFHGGTNFGFMNGANMLFTQYAPEITSYDYDAPLSEAGDYSEKYWKTKQVIEKLQNDGKIPNIKIPSPPQISSKAKYGTVKITEYIQFEAMLKMITPLTSEEPISMEQLNIGPNHGQNFGFILYRTKVSKFQNVRLIGGASDRAIIIIDAKIVATLELTNTDKNPEFNISSDHFDPSIKDHVLDIFVENMGRVNFGNYMDNQRKGLKDKVYIDDNVQRNWEIYPIQFKSNFVNSLKDASWKTLKPNSGPAIYRAMLKIDDHPKDTFLKIDSPWNKGIVLINGFNIGRYWNWGPQKSLYVPAPLLKIGNNDIYIFDMYTSGESIEFVDRPVLG